MRKKSKNTSRRRSTKSGRSSTQTKSSRGISLLKQLPSVISLVITAHANGKIHTWTTECSKRSLMKLLGTARVHSAFTYSENLYCGLMSSTESNTSSNATNATWSFSPQTGLVLTASPISLSGQAWTKSSGRGARKRDSSPKQNEYFYKPRAEEIRKHGSDSLKKSPRKRSSRNGKNGRRSK